MSIYHTLTKEQKAILNKQRRHEQLTDDEKAFAKWFFREATRQRTGYYERMEQTKRDWLKVVELREEHNMTFVQIGEIMLYDKETVRQWYFKGKELIKNDIQ